MTSTSWQTSSVSTLTDAVEDRVVGEQVGRDEQLGEVALALEHEGHGAGSSSGSSPPAAARRPRPGRRLAGWRVPSSSPVTPSRRLGPDDLGVDAAALGLGEDLGLADLDSGLRARRRRCRCSRWRP